MFTIYILYSPSAQQFYTGQTNNLSERIERHNKGLVLSTRRYKPWTLLYTETCSTRAKAMMREKFLKSGKGREFVRSLNLVERLLHPPKADVLTDL